MAKTLFDIQLNLAKSQGSYLYDDKRKCQFLDYFGLYSSVCLGYNHPIFDEEFMAQLQVLGPVKMANNVMETKLYGDFLREFSELTFSSYIQLSNSGSSAVENAIKVALKGRDYQKVSLLALKDSFHGIGAFGVATDLNDLNEKRLEGLPRIGFQHYSPESLLERLEEENEAVVLIEPIQSTVGDIHFDSQFFQELSRLCQEKNHCLIFDEVQTGMGVTGEYWYYEKLGITPDILVFGKKAQVSGIVVTEKYREVWEDPTMKIHQTFDGDLIDCLRFLQVKKAIEKEKLLENVKRKSDDLREFLMGKFENVRAEGFLLAYEFADQKSRDEHFEQCFEKRLLVNKTAEKSIRLRPNLALSDSELEAFKSLV